MNFAIDHYGTSNSLYEIKQCIFLTIQFSRKKKKKKRSGSFYSEHISSGNFAQEN